MNLLRIFSCLMLLVAFGQNLNAQTDRWQQAVKYKMNIDFDVNTHQFTGTQKLVYSNNSPESLDKVFYHLYFNAFQPNSMMDIRNKFLSDSDNRVKGRIEQLKPEQIGFQKIKSLKQNGKDVKFEVVGTILEVALNEPIAPNSKVTFDMEFEAQVPIQIRRSGRNNAEGIDYSMAQWYPKLCEYDYQGWHANPYVGREFHGVWGDFDVSIKIDKKQILGASGVLQNPLEIGYGYDKPGTGMGKAKDDKLTWRFLAKDVHDFVWASDPDYTHVSRQAKNGPMMHFLFKDNDDTDAWDALPEIMDHSFTYMNKEFGKYPYQVYSFIQGGDGGMEYPMATLITGHRPIGSLVGVSVHELFHSWYQMILGTNESLYAWMDEGFTTYGSAETMNHLKEIGALPGMSPVENPYENNYRGYNNLVESGVEEPMSTHADHFSTNYAYGQAAYTKGCVFVNQLKYVVGEQAFKKGMLRYFNDWKFKHPNPNDFIRIMEKESGLELDWYKEYWVNTIHTIDYKVASTKANKKQTVVKLERLGIMPMPLDVLVTLTNGKQEMINIPLQIMRGEKPQENKDINYTVAEDWPWTNSSYDLVLPFKQKKIAKIEIDPSHRLADINTKNNSLVVKK